MTDNVIKISEHTRLSKHRAPQDALAAVAKRDDLCGVLVIYYARTEDGCIDVGYECAQMMLLDRLGALEHAKWMIHRDLAARTEETE